MPRNRDTRSALALDIAGKREDDTAHACATRWRGAAAEALRAETNKFCDGEGAGYSNQYFVLKDSPVQTVADLKGKIVATNVAGSAVDIAMRAMLRKHGLEDKRDYTVVKAPFPTMKAMLTQKKADLASFVAPFSFDPELK
jgi:NitT/TauT family transport system substrate-binding protein